MLMVAIGVCKFIRPRVILLEQVKNFMQHKHYAKVMEILGGAGYFRWFIIRFPPCR